MTLLNEKSDWHQTKHPLIISSSGGNGHLIAAKSLVDKLQLQNSSLPQQLLFTPSQFTFPLEKVLFKLSQYYHHPHLGKILAKISPIELPHPKLIQQEIKRLKILQKIQRPYLDYMLDLQPDGFILTALFNLSQQKAHGPSLHHLTYHQNILDKYSKVKMQKKLEQILLHAIAEGKPYDFILMTQPMGLEGIAELVFQYNLNIQTLEQKYQIQIPKLYLHQFFTDIPSPQAFHYLRPIQHLPMEYRQHLVLHSMAVVNHQNGMKNLKDLAINFYQPTELPIIRQDFKQKKLRKHQQVKPGSATIMLSSSNGDLSIDYLKVLLELPFQECNIIGELSRKHQAIIKNLKANTDKDINLCGYIQAKALAKILDTSQCIVLKGGGMSLMELAALGCSKDRIICLHQSKKKNELSLSWEDGNNAWFKTYCKQHQQQVVNVHPSTLKNKLKARMTKF